MMMEAVGVSKTFGQFVSDYKAQHPIGQSPSFVDRPTFSVAELTRSLLTNIINESFKSHYFHHDKVQNYFTSFYAS